MGCKQLYADFLIFQTKTLFNFVVFYVGVFRQYQQSVQSEKRNFNGFNPRCRGVTIWLRLSNFICLQFITSYFITVLKYWLLFPMVKFLISVA